MRRVNSGSRGSKAGKHRSPVPGHISRPRVTPSVRRSDATADARRTEASGADGAAAGAGAGAGAGVAARTTRGGGERAGDGVVPPHVEPAAGEMSGAAGSGAAAAAAAAAGAAAGAAVARSDGQQRDTEDVLASRIMGLGPGSTGAAAAGGSSGSGGAAVDARVAGGTGMSTEKGGARSAGAGAGAGAGARAGDEGQGVKQQPKKKKEQGAPKHDDLGLGFDAEGFSASKRRRFTRIMSDSNVELAALTTLAWGGIPSGIRPTAWKLLLGLLPTNKERQRSVLQRKRSEYRGFVRQYFGEQAAYRTEKDKQTLRDVSVDVPRTHRELPLFHTTFMQQSLERVLFIWAMRHPASGYVQGINDIVTPFYTVMFQERGVLLDVTGEDVPDKLPLEEDVLMDIEAEVYWCLANLLDDYQDHYTFSQPGIQRMVFRLQELVHRLDGDLAEHVDSVGIKWMQLCFRWMNCLLLRELPHRLALRLWDTLLCEEDGFETFHVYVCATLMVEFADHVKTLDFAELLGFVQKGLPATLAKWKPADIDSLLGKAYINKTLFESAPRHLHA